MRRQSETKEDKTENLKDFVLDLFLVKQQFDKWYKEEESLSGVMNMKVTKQKNLDFRLKLDVWRKRENERARYQKRSYD